jgi:hypothetical protein
LSDAHKVVGKVNVNGTVTILDDGADATPVVLERIN